MSLATGSSPHPRGTPRHRPTPGGWNRFIPAPAGNTTRHPRPAHRRAVHPRTRGEHCASGIAPSVWRGSSPHPRGTLWLAGQELSALSEKARGSSPHPRGTLVHLVQLLECRRFIPAPAGNTRHQRTPGQARPVHPRTRGEHVGQKYHLPSSHGSSPHPRGTLRMLRAPMRCSRFIPAPAGNTAAVPGGDRRHCGSSPHPRGTRNIRA